jgi:hypothetical protein
MNMLTIRNFVRPAIFLGSAGVIAIALSACVSPEQERYADQDTCSSMGARYGSSTNTQCMLQQQQRRDQKNLIFLEEARIHSELARNAQEMRDRKKRRDNSGNL